MLRQDIDHQENRLQRPAIPDHLVRQQVERIIASRVFSRSSRLTRLLRFIVEATLTGETNSVKEWVIGTEVYDRGKDFDPRLDPIVRTESRRLRLKLGLYYATEGQKDALVLEVPKGSYVPSLRFRYDDAGFGLREKNYGSDSVLETLDNRYWSALEEVLARGSPPNPAGRCTAAMEPYGDSFPNPVSPRIPDTDERSETSVVPYNAGIRRSNSFIRTAKQHIGTVKALICVMAIAGIAGVRWVPRASGTGVGRRISVLPVSCPAGDLECPALVSSLTSSLKTRLGFPHGAEIAAMGVLPPLQGAKPSPTETEPQVEAGYLLLGTVDSFAAARTFTARIIRVSDEAVVWSGQFDLSRDNLPVIQSQLLREVMTYVNDDAGALSPSKRQGASGALSPEKYQVYGRAQHAVDTLVAVRERPYFDYAEQELKRAMRTNPDFDEARILLAQLYYQEIWGSPQRAMLLEKSKSLLETVIHRNPDRADANALLAGALSELGQRERAMDLARRALRLGPLASIPHRELAKLYAEAGFFESAVIEEDRALAADPGNLTALGFKVLFLSWMGKQTEADSALRTFREWQPAGLADRLAADRELRTGNYPIAGRLIVAELGHTSNPVNIEAAEIAEALCAALTGNRNQARRIFEKYPDQPPRFFDHYILLAAQVGDAQRAVDYIRRNPLYFNYRYVVTEPRLAPVRGAPAFQALLNETHGRWRADLAKYGPSLPTAPALLPTPRELLTQR